MKIEFDLLTNATDSISQAIALLAWKDEPSDARRLKQAVMAIAHGVELLLKERLRRVHPVLIWENVDKFPSLSARTVTVDVALNRLMCIGGLQFLADDSELISSLRDTRNAIEHYAWTTTKAEADRIVGRPWVLLFTSQRTSWAMIFSVMSHEKTIPFKCYWNRTHTSQTRFAKGMSNVQKKPVNPICSATIATRLRYIHQPVLAGFVVTGIVWTAMTFRSSTPNPPIHRQKKVTDGQLP